MAARGHDQHCQIRSASPERCKRIIQPAKGLACIWFLRSHISPSERKWLTLENHQHEKDATSERTCSANHNFCLRYDLERGTPAGSWGWSAANEKCSALMRTSGLPNAMAWHHQLRAVSRCQSTMHAQQSTKWQHMCLIIQRKISGR